MSERERERESLAYIQRLLELGLRQTLHATEITTQNATQLVAGDAVGFRGGSCRSIAAAVIGGLRDRKRGRERSKEREKE